MALLVCKIYLIIQIIMQQHQHGPNCNHGHGGHGHGHGHGHGGHGGPQGLGFPNQLQ